MAGVNVSSSDGYDGRQGEAWLVFQMGCYPNWALTVNNSFTFGVWGNYGHTN